MDKASFATTLNRHAIVAVDSMVFIYHIEGHSSYLPLTRVLFKRIEMGKNRAVSSHLSLMEVLTLPYRKGRQDLALLYRSLLTEFPHLTLWPLDQETSELAASIRAHHDFSTPDAIQLATALRQGATAFVTNDKQLKKNSDLDVLLLDSFL
jgi:predicted nucleic acid-binding protein